MTYRPPPEKIITCPKCNAISGDDWRQCDGVCPMPHSPYFDANLHAALCSDAPHYVEYYAKYVEPITAPVKVASGKIKICLDDPETRAVWETALEAQREVARWPAWKRGY